MILYIIIEKKIQVLIYREVLNKNFMLSLTTKRLHYKKLKHIFY